MSASDAEMIMLRVTKYKTSVLNFKLCAKTLCIHMAYKIGIYDSFKPDRCAGSMDHVQCVNDCRYHDACL